MYPPATWQRKAIYSSAPCNEMRHARSYIHKAHTQGPKQGPTPTPRSQRRRSARSHALLKERTQFGLRRLSSQSPMRRRWGWPCRSKSRCGFDEMGGSDRSESKGSVSRTPPRRCQRGSAQS
jgi:hypothetical protein